MLDRRIALGDLINNNLIFGIVRATFWAAPTLHQSAYQFKAKVGEHSECPLR